MKKLILVMHTSLDGFVAGPNGEMDWIKVDEEIFDFGGKFTDEADTALYGRVTWQMMETYWPTAAEKPNATRHDITHAKWYNNVTKIVISKSIKKIDREKTKIIKDNILSEINALKKQSGLNIIMYGSPTVVHLLAQYNLIDDYWLFVNPVVLGKGITLFSGIQKKIPLTFLESNTFSCGVVGLHYEIKSML